MSEHPIEGLMMTAMDSIKDMVDVNTIIGEPIETSNNVVIIPISKVSFGFAAGGSEFKGETINEYTKREKEEAIQYRLPFGGGSGAGVSINPVAFLVVQKDNIKLLPINHASTIDKLIDYVPDIIEKTNCIISDTINLKAKPKENKNEEKNEGKNKNEKKSDNKEVSDVNFKNRKVVRTDEELIKEKLREAREKRPSRIKEDTLKDDYEIEYDETAKEDDDE